MNEHYLPFLLMVVFTVASPGPGVLMTLDNALALGWRSSMNGVLGLAIGAAVMASLSSAGVGLLIRSSQTFFLILKYLGIGYLFYLAYRTWHRDQVPASIDDRPEECAREGRAREGSRLLVRGALLQTSNPKSLLFFLAVLPQLVDGRGIATAPLIELGLAIATYCIVLVAIHALYAGLAAKARRWLEHPASARAISRVSASVFFLFGITMLNLQL